MERPTQPSEEYDESMTDLSMGECEYCGATYGWCKCGGPSELELAEMK